MTDFRTVAPDNGLLGIVIAPETVDVASQLEGRLKYIKVRTGDSVERDDVIARFGHHVESGRLAWALSTIA